MEEIGGFWLGAQAHGGEVDLCALAAELGGWEPLVTGGASALVRGGVAPVRAQAWVRTAPRPTRGRVLTLADDRYPSGLRALSAPPPFVVVEGDLAALDRPAVAVVGTRSCTAYGRGVAQHLGGALAAAGAVVVSGLARGIDGAAHRGTLGIGPTIAVLGHGLDHTAPRLHRHLRERILSEGGLMLTSWADAVQPRPFRFPIRNRWLAALVEHLVVVEAPLRSGALITARLAMESREVWAVPGPLGRRASQGCLALLEQGAGLVTDVETWVAEVTRTRPRPREDWLLELFGGRSVDAVARATRRSTAELLAELSVLELRGEVVRLPGQRYAPAGSAQ